MTRAEVEVRLAELEIEGRSAAARYEAHVVLHRAATITGSRTELAQRRDELHTLLDAVLDNSEAVHALARMARVC